MILDASALLAFLYREAGHEEVAKALPYSLISTVNVAEVLGRFARDGHDCHTVLSGLRASPLQMVDFSPEHATLAAALLPATRPLGLSLGDRACLALAMERKAPALTADQAGVPCESGSTFG